MDHLLDWLDTGLLGLQHAWGWASVTVVLATVTVIGIAAIARRYGHPDSPQHG